MKTKLLFIGMTAIVLLVAWSGTGLVRGYAQQPAAQPLAELPPRPTPGPSPTPTVQAPGAVKSNQDDFDVQLSISAYPAETGLGERVTFTILVSNPGEQKIGGFYVVALLPPELEVLEVNSTLGTTTFNPQNNRPKVFIKPLMPYAGATITVTARVGTQAVTGEQYYSAAQATRAQAGSPKIFSNWIGTQVIQK